MQVLKLHAFLISITFISNGRLKLAKNQANAKQYPEAELLLFENLHILHPRYHPKIIGHILKNKKKYQFVFLDEIIWVIIMKMKMKMKNRSHIYNINSPRSRHIVNKRSVSVWLCLNVLSSTSATFEAQFMRKLSNTEAELKKKRCFFKKVCNKLWRPDNWMD